MAGGVGGRPSSRLERAAGDPGHAAIEDVLSGSVDPAVRAMVKFRLANFLAWGVADFDAAERACEEARSLFDDAGVRSGALLAENELAWIHGLRNEYPAMQTVAERVLVSAEAAGDRFATIQALTVLAQASFFRGRFAEGGGTSPAEHRDRHRGSKDVQTDDEPRAPRLLTRIRGTPRGGRPISSSRPRRLPSGARPSYPSGRRSFSGSRATFVRRSRARKLLPPSSSGSSANAALSGSHLPRLRPSRG